MNHAINVEPGKAPPFGPLYNLSETELKVLKEYINTNLQNGFISPSTSSTGAPILFTKKKDGSLRLCVDYQGLNNITIKDRYPIPLVSEILDRLVHSKIFTKLDLRGAYNLLRIQEGDEWMTAFRTRYSLYEYNVMPFGLANAPATFQAYINKALAHLLDKTVIVYLDDLLIYSKDPEGHVKDVIDVLQALWDARLFTKLSKCTFGSDTIEFLGFIVTTEGIQMDPERVKTVTEWPVPKTTKQIQSFLGFCNFYR